MSVYFAEAGGYIKIGYSADPIRRATTITRLGLRPDDLPPGADVDLLGWIPGDTWREGELHAQYRSSRVAGEWFRLGRETARAHIWDDPRGVDLHRMTATATFVCMKYPTLTREQIEGAGVAVLSPYADRQFDGRFDFHRSRA